MHKDRLSRTMKVIVLLLALVVCTTGPLYLRWQDSQGIAEAANPVLKVGGTGISALTTNYAGRVWPSSSAGQEPVYSDIYMSIVAVPTVNTTTVTLQTSPNGAAWFTHTTAPTLWSNVITTSSAVSGHINVEGAVFRIVVTLVTDTTTVTPTFYIVTH